LCHGHAPDRLGLSALRKETRCRWSIRRSSSSRRLPVRTIPSVSADMGDESVIRRIGQPLVASLLLTMRHGHVYSAANLGRLLGVSVDEITNALCKLVEDGTIRASDIGSDGHGYCRDLPGQTLHAGRDDSQQAATSIATFPVTRKLEGTLSGYEKAMEQHRALAMLARR
jgi:hypothetical protein